MAEFKQKSQMSGSQGEHIRYFPLGRWWPVLVVFTFFVIAGVCIWKLSNLGILPKSLSSILNPVFAVIIAIFTACLAILTAIDKFFPVKSLLPQTEPSQQNFDRIICLPPSINFITTAEHKDEIEEIYQKLIQSDVTALVITGIDGIGKSTLARLVYDYAEEQRLNLHSSPFNTRPIWLKFDSNVTMVDLAGTLFKEFGKPMPDFNRLSPLNQATELYNLLNTTHKPRLIVLDQFDRLLYGQTRQVLKKHQAIGEWLGMLNNQKFEKSACRLLITSRIRPQEVSPSQIRCIVEYRAQYLTEDKSVALLRQYGIQQEEAVLREAVKKCGGHASALIYLSDIVKRYDLKLTNLFNDSLYEELWRGDIARNLLDYIYTRQLTEAQRKLLQAFSIYRESVPMKAVQIVMGISKGLAHDLDVLHEQQLLNASENGYQLTAIVAAYAKDHFDEGNMQSDQQSLQTAYVSAAKYYVQQLEEYRNYPVPSTSSMQKQGIDEIHLLAEAIWHYCKAEQWQAAYDLMEQNGFFADFNGPGINIGLVEAYQLLLSSEKWQPGSLQRAHVLNNLAMIYADLGQKERARNYFEDALSIWKDKGESRWEGVTLSNLGRVESALGKKKEALRKYKKALDILQNVGEHIWIGTTLSYLGRVYGSLGHYAQAKDAYERALSILRDEDDCAIESITLGYLGVISSRLGQKEEGLKYCKSGMDIAKEIGDLRAEGRVLNNFGRCYSIWGDYEQAQIQYEEALKVSREARDRSGEGVVIQNMGDICNMRSLTDQAKVYYEEALSILTEVGDHWRESMVLNNLGDLYADTKQWEASRENYKKALKVRRGIDDRNGEASILYNLGKLFLLQESYETGLAYFMAAQRIFNEIQNSRSKEVEDQINGLRTILGEIEFMKMFAKAEAQANFL